MIAMGMFILFGFGFETVGLRLWIDVDGTVTSSTDLPDRRAARYATDYTISSPDGHESTYTAGATDASLARSLPLGTKIIKRRWELGYFVDGRWIAFPMYFYGPVLALGFGSLVSGLLRRRQERRDARVYRLQQP